MAMGSCGGPQLPTPRTQMSLTTTFVREDVGCSRHRNVGEHGRAHHLDNNNRLRCLLPCSTEPFCPFHWPAAERSTRIQPKPRTDTKGTNVAGAKNLQTNAVAHSNGLVAYRRPHLQAPVKGVSKLFRRFMGTFAEFQGGYLPRRSGSSKM